MLTMTSDGGVLLSRRLFCAIFATEEFGIAATQLLPPHHLPRAARECSARPRSPRNAGRYAWRALQPSGTEQPPERPPSSPFFLQLVFYSSYWISP